MGNIVRPKNLVCRCQPGEGFMKHAIQTTALLFLFVHICLADPGQRRALRVGGMELSPFGYGVMETHPHQALDSTNTNFADYYAHISLWLCGITAAGDTLIACPELAKSGEAAGFVAKRLYRDTTNVLQLPNVEFTTVSVYQDTVAGWRVRQFNVALQDHSAGILAYLIRYSGQQGNLANVYAGVYFDFDAPNSENHPTPDDDRLALLTGGYAISDFHSGQGMNLGGAFSPLLRNYWQRSQAPASREAVYGRMSQGNVTTPPDTADYHVYLGSGPFALSAGQGILLVYTLEPEGSGFSKSAGSNGASELWAALQEGIAEFSRDKQLAAAGAGPAQRETLVSGLPETSELFQNYPNPFNPRTNFGLQIADFGFVELKIYDVTGRLVRTLVSENKAPGSYTVQWDGTDARGQAVSSGIYLYRLTAAGFQAQKKMLLIR